jgi:hypothetical protein
MDDKYNRDKIIFDDNWSFKIKIEVPNIKIDKSEI